LLGAVSSSEGRRNYKDMQHLSFRGFKNNILLLGTAHYCNI
jgi:hypothetical protein